MHGQDLTVIMLLCPAVLSFSFSEFFWYIYQTSPFAAVLLGVLPRLHHQQHLYFSLPQVPPRCCRYQLDAPGSLTHSSTTICYPHTSSMFVPIEGGAVYGKSSYLGIVPAATQLLVHSEVSLCLCVHAWYLPCVCGNRISVPTWPSASCCPRKSFELYPGKPLGTGSGRLPGTYVQSCQMDLCPSRLHLVQGPWQKIRTESFYKGAGDSLQSPANLFLK